MVHSIKDDQTTLIQKIKLGDSKVITQIYRQDFVKIKAMVTHFQYINLDAQDVFQEGLTQAIINIRKGVFKGDSSISTYLYGICRNICLKDYNRNKNYTKTEIGEMPQEPEADNFDTIKLLIAVKDKLDPLCVSIIDMRFGIGVSNTEDPYATRFETIAQRLNITSDNARQRFGRCMAKLKELIEANGILNQLSD